MNEFINFYQVIGKLKHLKRTGWLLFLVDDAESVASHSYRMAMMALTLKEKFPELDILKSLKLALCHDVAEAIVGDIPRINVTKSSLEDKYLKEHEAIKQIARIIDFDDLVLLWQEYEEAKTKEAVFINDLDVFDLILQAYEYHLAYPHLDGLEEFKPNNINRIKNKPIFDMANEIPDF